MRRIYAPLGTDSEDFAALDVFRFFIRSAPCLHTYMHVCELYVQPSLADFSGCDVVGKLDVHTTWPWK